MVKTVGYYIFALVYYICRLFPIQDKRVFCIMTHDDGVGSNVNILVRKLKELKPSYFYNCIKKTDIKKPLSFFLIKPYMLARSGVILMDNVFLPLAYIKLRKDVKVIQLWHGTGTIKKFGQDSNTGKLKELERRANNKITHLIVNNEKTAKLYASVFAVDIDKVYPLGLPKTDDILNRKLRNEKQGINPEKTDVYSRYNIPMDKKLILYAPTFRDGSLSSEMELEKVEELASLLPSNYMLGLRLHPHVAGMARKKDMTNVCDLSDDKDLSSLIMASDILITDYSSIVFEYCITEKPMIFFAYDLEEFSSHGRGFYEDYQTYVPGPVVRSCREVVDIIKEDDYSQEKIKEFNKYNFTKLDGKAFHRIIKLLEA